LAGGRAGTAPLDTGIGLPAALSVATLMGTIELLAMTTAVPLSCVITMSRG